MANDTISGRKLPAGLRFHDPTVLVATAGGAGLLPRCPGTWGSLVALPPAWAVAVYFGNLWLIAAAAVVFSAGLWASSRYLRLSSDTDPAPIVVDEVAGQFLALAAVPPDPWWYAAAFALFRLLDIAKPGPVSWAERKLEGALAVMADDIVAGTGACVVLGIAYYFAGA